MGDVLVLGTNDGNVSAISTDSSSKYNVYKSTKIHTTAVKSISTTSAEFVSASASDVVWGYLDTNKTPAKSRSLTNINSNNIASASIAASKNRTYIGYEGGSVQTIGDINLKSETLTGFNGQQLAATALGDKALTLSSAGVLRVWGPYDSLLLKSDSEVSSVAAFGINSLGEVVAIVTTNTPQG